MFTGIISVLGKITAIDAIGNGRRLHIRIQELANDAAIGDSIAVNGACLTITSLTQDLATFDVSAETLSKTNMSMWSAGQQVNLEGALRLGDKLGGHMVSGHVDGLGSLVSRQDDGECCLLTFALPRSGAVKVVEKGSICIDGISLTCFNLKADQFQVAVIPHTLQVTTLGALQPKSPVHMEQDMIGRWVATLLPA